MEVLFQIGKELAELRARVEKLESENYLSKPCVSRKDKIKFYLHVCSHKDNKDTQETVKAFGNTFPIGFSGEIKVDYWIENDFIYFKVPEFGHNPKLGGASKALGIKIFICDSKISVHTIYDDAEIYMRPDYKCCKANGCECYAIVGCDC